MEFKKIKKTFVNIFSIALLMAGVFFALQPVPVKAAACASDQIIKLAYPNDLDLFKTDDPESVTAIPKVHEDYVPHIDKKYLGNQRPPTLGDNEAPSIAKAPANHGLIWVPKEACGKQSVDLIIALHGWRSFKKPGANVYLETPDQKRFDAITRELMNSNGILPIIIAAPLHDRGPDQIVWTPEAYNVNTHISKILSTLKAKGINTQFSRVTLIGHSNANCAGGLARAAKELQGYSLYIYGAADGTCAGGNGPFFETYDIFNTVKQKGAILFHVHQNGSDAKATAEIKSKQNGGNDPEALAIDQYNDMWRGVDGKTFSYRLTPGGDHNHTNAPQYLLRQILPRFFTNKSYDPTAAKPGASGNNYQTTNVPIFLTDEAIAEKLAQPLIKIKIPGLDFSDISAVNLKKIDSDGTTYLDLPFIGEYLSGVYRYLVIIAGIVSVAMIIVAGFQYTIPDPSGESKSAAKNRLIHAVTGLIITLTSYTILYTINPELVQFKNLKIIYIRGENLPMPNEETVGASETGLQSDTTITEKITSVSDVKAEMFLDTDINKIQVKGYPIWESLSFEQKNEVLPYLFRQIATCPNENNFMTITDIPDWNGKKIHPTAIDPLKKAISLGKELGFKIYPGGTLRTSDSLVKLWNTGVMARYQTKTKGWQSNQGIISKPTCDSPHATGGAVDANIKDLKTNTKLVAGNKVPVTKGNYDNQFLNDPYKIILEYIFNQAGWVRLCTEHWHFEYGVTVRYQKWDKKTRCWAYTDSFDQPIPPEMKNKVNSIVGKKIL